MAEDDIRAERLKKLELLKAAGMEAYPAESHRDISNADARANFDELEKSGKKIHIGGRVMSLRGQGGIMFADLYDGTARLQAVLQKADMDLPAPSTARQAGEALFKLFSE